jgi:hypothetical protein
MINERNGTEYFSKVNMNGEEVEEINETSDGSVVAKSGPPGPPPTCTFRVIVAVDHWQCSQLHALRVTVIITSEPVNANHNTGTAPSRALVPCTGVSPRVRHSSGTESKWAESSYCSTLTRARHAKR